MNIEGVALLYRENSWSFINMRAIFFVPCEMKSKLRMTEECTKIDYKFTSFINAKIKLKY